MNKEELLKEYDEKAKALRDEFISKLEDDKEGFELTYPGKDLWVNCVDSDTGEIIEIYYNANNMTDRFLFEHGYYFETKEEAKQHLKERKLLFKLHQWAKLKNAGWEVNWKDFNQDKVYITCFRNLMNQNKLVSEISCATNRFSKLPYFKSKEIAQECIELFGDEIKEVLVND